MQEKTDAQGDVAVHRNNSWCQRITAHIADLQGQINRFGMQAAENSPQDAEILRKAAMQLKAARDSLQESSLWSRTTGGATDRALANVHEAEVALLRIAPQEELRWKGLSVLVQARLHLDPEDLRLRHLEELLLPDGKYTPLVAADRELAASALHASYQAEEAERAKVRSFTHIVCAAATAMALIAVGFAVWAFLDKSIGELFCFPENPDKPNSKKEVCPFGTTPTWRSVWFIEFIGLLSAAVAGAVSLRRVRGSSGPYHVATSLLLLRLPVGALTAVIGIILLSGRFFPGLTALDTPTQIIAWGAAFGILQEIVTRTVDQQGQLLLDNVRTPGRDTEPYDETRHGGQPGKMGTPEPPGS
ncbi:hypothetical protein [Streptomyces sp. NPDC051218]|uniref:hypothetical protein n=1 Tax=Streptomyces sp. NPDC051218 TaxID=3365645 RepID=UPI0037902841